MLNPSRQFRALYRSFLRRIVDLELLSAQGDVTRLLIQFAALLGAFSFVFSINALPQYWLSQLPPKQLALAAVGDQEFLIATTMAVVGLFAVLSWDAVFPDIRDILVLSALPVRARTVLAAKIAAVTTGLGISVFAINAVTGLWYPFVVIHPEAGMLGGLRSFAAYWTAMTAAGLFVFCALLAIQGLAARLLPYRVFLRASSFLQLAAFFVILGGYFLTPGPDNLPVALASSRPMLARLPSYWFLGLFQEMNGPIDRLLGDQVFGPLARRALWSLSIAAAAACATYALAWRRMVRRIVEQPDIVPADRARPAAHLLVLLGHRLLRKPIERAVVLFTARTLARSRPHRIVLAAFLGVGLAISMAYTRSLLYGSSVQGQFEPGWFQPNVPLTAAGFAMLFFTLAGMRAVFALPAALKANWIFRLTAVHSPQAYFGSIRKAMLGVAAAPVWLALTALYFSLWPAGSAALYVILMSAAGLILLTRLLIGFHKIPFTCSYLPGKSNMKIKLGAYGIALLTLIHLAALFSNGMLETPARTVVLGVILTAMLIRAQQRWTEFAGSPYQQLQFEDAEIPEVMPLSLKRDGAFTSNLQYLDATPSVPSKPLRFRLAAILRLTAATLAILGISGAIYEQVNARRDRIRYPQIGRSYDIGGRSLNLYCAGTGSPAVIFEGTQGTAGYAWAVIQEGVAGFTRACWYDRAGYGWSDPGPFPNHADSIARDLHKLLHAAAIGPPYVLVGHALGSFAARVFAGYYPDDMAGLVLLDPFNEDTTIRVHNHIEAFRPFGVWFPRAAGHVGWWRLIGRSPGPPPQGWTEDRWAIAFAMGWQAKTVAARIGEPPLWVSGELARAARPSLSGLPLMILSGEKQPEMVDGEDNQQELQRHAELAHSSRRGVHEVIAGSGDWNPFNTPGVVIEAVRGIVQQAGLKK